MASGGSELRQMRKSIKTLTVKPKSICAWPSRMATEYVRATVCASHHFVFDRMSNRPNQTWPLLTNGSMHAEQFSISFANENESMIANRLAPSTPFNNDYHMRRINELNSRINSSRTSSIIFFLFVCIFFFVCRAFAFVPCVALVRLFCSCCFLITTQLTLKTHALFFTLCIVSTPLLPRIHTHTHTHSYVLPQLLHHSLCFFRYCSLFRLSGKFNFCWLCCYCCCFRRRRCWASTVVFINKSVCWSSTVCARAFEFQHAGVSLIHVFLFHANVSLLQ